MNIFPSEMMHPNIDVQNPKENFHSSTFLNKSQCR